MPKIPATEIARHAQAAGFRGMNLQVAVAIALAESNGGDTTAHRVTSREDSRGLWQINVRAHPELASNLFDPATNARAAFAVHRKQGFDAWSVWKPQGLNPAYLARMPQAGAAIQSLPLSAPTGQIGEGVATKIPGVTALDEVGNAVKFLTVGRNWGRIAEITLGGILLIIALNILAKPVTEPIARTAVKGARLAATKGL